MPKRQPKLEILFATFENIAGVKGPQKVETLAKQPDWSVVVLRIGKNEFHVEARKGGLCISTPEGCLVVKPLITNSVVLRTEEHS